MTLPIYDQTELNRRIATARVSAEAITECIRLLRSGAFASDCGTGQHLGVIARRHGGDDITARAMHIRLTCLTMLLNTDPDLRVLVERLPYEALGAILSGFKITADGPTLEVSGDALADALRAALVPAGTA